jgi:small subunit ribosomal protein S21
LAPFSGGIFVSEEQQPARQQSAQQVGDAIQCKAVEVVVGEKGVERAIKHLKRKMAAEGILRELKRRRHYMKPSVKRRKKESEAARRRRKREKQVTTPGPSKM